MIPRKDDNTLLTNSKNESAFAIEANAKTFSLLSDKIYTYKIAAIIRELSCNAFDSHIDAGKGDVPFKVILPNMFHPYFEVEDFGLGMDDEDVRNVYTIYGASTKTTSNDVIGAMGIGSKSPFAYTKTFTIRARKDGIERLYNAYIGEEGAPKINMVSKSRTEECNGVKVTIPVSDLDYNSFRFDAEFILSFFNPKPIVEGNDVFDFIYDSVADDLNSDELVIGKTTKGNNASSLYQSANIFAVMGSVCYSVSSSELDETTQEFFNVLLDSNSNFNRDYDKQIFLKFEMGSLDFASSREKLSMDDQTREILTTEFANAVLRKYDQIQDVIDQAEHYLDAYKVLREQLSLGNGTIPHTVLKHFTWNGKTFKQLGQKLFHFPGLDFMTLYQSSYGFYSSSNISTERNTPIAVRELENKQLRILYCNEGEKPTGAIKYSREFIERNRKIRTIVFKTPLTERTKARLERLLPGADWTNLPEYRKQQLALDGPKQLKIELDQTEVNAPYYQIRFGDWYSEEKNLANIFDLQSVSYRYFYVNPLDIFENHVGTNLKMIKQFFDINGHTDKPVVIFVKNQRTQSKLIKNKIPSLESYIRETFKDTNVQQYLVDCNIVSELFDTTIDYTTYPTKTTVRMDSEYKLFHKVKPIVFQECSMTPDDIEDMDYDDYYTMRNHSGLEGFFGFSEFEGVDQIKERTEKEKDYVKALFDDYPLLKHLDVNRGDDIEQHISDYVQIVDELNALQSYKKVV